MCDILESIRLILVEDHLMMRAALKMMLQGYSHLEVVAETETCAEALELVAQQRPDLVLLDVFLANHSSLDFIAALRARSLQTRILMLTGASDISIYERAMAKGAQGVVRKEESPDVLLQAIEHIHSGHLWFGTQFDFLPSQRENASQETDGNEKGSPRLTLLTVREREVVQLIEQGLKNKAIAMRMGVSDKTVQHHLTAIFRKLGVNDRLELAALLHRSH